MLCGFAFGALLQRSRLCFAAAFRDLFLAKERRAAVGLLAALAVGLVGHHVVFGAQLPNPTLGYVPPTAFISRVSWHTLSGGVAFGLGMVAAGGCISGQLWRLGEGAVASLVALAGIVAGQLVGQMAWNGLWVGVIAEAPTVWLPKSFGYAGSLAIELAAVGALALLLLRFVPTAKKPAAAEADAASGSGGRGSSGDVASALARVFREPWPAALAGAALGGIATLALFRGAPLGVTAELSRLAREVGNATGLLPERLEGLDQISGCRPPDGTSGLLLSNNGLLVVALVVGSLAAALASGEFRPRVAKPRALVLALLGGVLLGFGAFIASGCTVGALLSGVMASSGHGWVFAGGLAAGAWLGVVLLRKLAPSGTPSAATAATTATASALPRLDLRGESCGMPTARLEAFLATPAARPSFALLVDDAATHDTLATVAQRHGWRPRAGSPRPITGEAGVLADFDRD